VNKSSGKRLLGDDSNRQEAFAIDPKIWQLLICSLFIFLFTLGAGNINFGWLNPVELNNIATKSTPWPFQIIDFFDDVITPISLFIAVLIAIRLSPRNKYTIAIADGTLIFVATRYIIWRMLTINTAHALSFAMSMLIYLY
jgi:hypothetical protein